MTDLERENTVALQAMQALLGLVSGGIRGVAVELVADTVVLYVAVQQRTAELDEDLVRQSEITISPVSMAD